MSTFYTNLADGPMYTQGSIALVTDASSRPEVRAGVGTRVQEVAPVSALDAGIRKDLRLEASAIHQE